LINSEEAQVPDKKLVFDKYIKQQISVIGDTLKRGVVFKIKSRGGNSGNLGSVNVDNDNQTMNSIYTDVGGIDEYIAIKIILI